jgi:ADP-ribose pyrophosphatase YjhB (NUDIX family)
MVLPSQENILTMFNLRVYGVLVNDDEQILVSDEFIRGSYITKFPGGGLEFGEGTRECLRREFLEEMSLDVSVEEHIYTTDYFQISAFNPSHQIISIYYRVQANDTIKVPLRDKPFDFDEQQLQVYHKTGETETFRFINFSDFSADCMTLPIDKIVAEIILAER